MRKPLCLVLALLALLPTAGCTATTVAPTAVTPGVTPARTPVVTATSGSTVASTASVEAQSEPEGEAAVVLVYKRSGGFAGVDESWTVYEDGRVVDASGKESTVSISELADVIAQAQQAGFFDQRLAVDRKSACADCFTYELEMSVDGQRNKVAFKDAQQDVPDAIWRLLASVQGLVGQ